MTPTRKFSRRSFLAKVAGGSVLAGSALTLIEGRAQAQIRSGCSDSDRGQGSDASAYGRHCRPATGATDGDTGANADPVNGGRRSRTGCSDGDSGSGSDPGGYGRHCGRTTGATDNDSGPNADPTNGGRGYAHRNCSDSDSGSNSDNSGQGRHC